MMSSRVSPDPDVNSLTDDRSRPDSAAEASQQTSTDLKRPLKNDSDRKSVIEMDQRSATMNSAFVLEVSVFT